MIPFAKPFYDHHEHEAVAKVLDSGRLTAGPRIQEAETRLAELCGAKHCVLVSSCTAALHLMLDHCHTTSHCYIPSLTHAATHLATSTTVFIADVDANGVMAMSGAWGETPVDYLGQKAPRHELSFVDAAHSLHTLDGALGQCLSFHPSKILTCGEGGAFLTDDDNAADIARAVRSFGYAQQPADRKRGGTYDVRRYGFNYRMTEMQAALLLCQLDKLGTIRAKRIANFEAWDSFLAPWRHFDMPEMPYCYQIKLPADLSPLDAQEYPDAAMVERDHQEWDLHAWHRNWLQDRIHETGVETAVHYRPVHTLTYFKRSFVTPPRLPMTEEIAASTLSLPVGPHIESEDILALRDKVLPLMERVGGNP